MFNFDAILMKYHLLHVLDNIELLGNSYFSFVVRCMYNLIYIRQVPT